MDSNPLIAGQMSSPGVGQRVNQDTVTQCIPRHPALLARKGALFVIADGMRFSPGGEVASRLAARTVLSGYYAHPADDPIQSLQAAVATANHWLRYWSDVRPDLRGMGTTLTAVVVRGQELLIAHVGDSRAYLVRGGSAWLLTRDHTWVADALARGLLTPQEAAHHPWRHTLTRHLGGPAATPDVRQVTYWPGDRLVLCSDGVSDLLNPSEIAWLASLPPQRAARALVATARQRGGRDDASAIVVWLGRPAERRRPSIPATPAARGQRYRGNAVPGALSLRSPSLPILPLALALGMAWMITLIAMLMVTR